MGFAFRPLSGGKRVSGRRLSSSTGSYSACAPNPDPYRFRIRACVQGSRYIVACVEYPDCTTFEGNKFLVLKCSPSELYTASELDPHFFNDHKLGLVARFVPTQEGWNLACALAGADDAIIVA